MKFHSGLRHLIVDVAIGNVLAHSVYDTESVGLLQATRQLSELEVSNAHDAVLDPDSISDTQAKEVLCDPHFPLPPTTTFRAAEDMLRQGCQSKEVEQAYCEEVLSKVFAHFNPDALYSSLSCPLLPLVSELQERGAIVTNDLHDAGEGGQHNSSADTPRHNTGLRPVAFDVSIGSYLADVGHRCEDQIRDNIITADECQAAYDELNSRSMFQYGQKRPLVVLNPCHTALPRGCSVQYASMWGDKDQTPHWNPNCGGASPEANYGTAGSSPRFASGEFRVLCEGKSLAEGIAREMIRIVNWISHTTSQFNWNRRRTSDSADTGGGNGHDGCNGCTMY